MCQDAISHVLVMMFGPNDGASNSASAMEDQRFNDELRQPVEQVKLLKPLPVDLME